MNIQQINDNLQVKDFLEKSGISPSYQKGNSYWYISPIRETESTPSFKVDTRQNRWYDFGAGEGGKLFDLARRLYQGNDIAGVIKKVTGLFLLSPAGNSRLKSFTADQQQSLLGTEKSQNNSNSGNISTLIHSSSPNNSKNQNSNRPNSNNGKKGQLAGSPRTIIKNVGPLGKSYPLVRYLNARGISKQTANAYCREVGFSIADKSYSAIGFENRSGGYELRNDWFKGSSSPKDITFIANGSNAVCLIEGFIDFLSLLELREQVHLNANFLILNSVAMLNKSLDILRAHRDVFLFLDHDKAGKETAEKLLLAGINGIDSSGFYQGFKDVNEYLVSGQPRQESRSVRGR